jgi:hypothetical protein
MKLDYKNFNIDTTLYDDKALFHTLNIKYTVNNDKFIYFLPISTILLNDKIFIDTEFENFISKRANELFEMNPTIVNIELSPHYSF